MGLNAALPLRKVDALDRAADDFNLIATNCCIMG